MRERRRSVNLSPTSLWPMVEGQEQRKSGRRRGKVSRSECQTKTDFNAAELSMQALHGHAAGSLTSTRWPPPRPHLDGVTRAIFVNHFSAIGSSMSTPRTCTRAVTATCSTFTCSMLIWAVEGREEHVSTRRESEIPSPTSCEVAPGVPFGVKCSRFCAVRLAAATFSCAWLSLT